VNRNTRPPKKTTAIVAWPLGNEKLVSWISVLNGRVLWINSLMM